MTAFESFHPAVRAWFQRSFEAPTRAQLAGWDAIAAGRDALIAAPTGSGKTLAAFLSSIDSLMKRGLDGGLPDSIDVVYVSPLKALSSDIQRNLEAPLEGIREVAREMGITPPNIRTALRTGDTTQAARAAILRNAPHILITTPESLYLMLTAERSRALLRNVRTVIVDELHALMRDKRGSHLMLTLARLDALCEQRPLRIGLSATVHPIQNAAAYLVGTAKIATDGAPDCTVVDVGHQRDLDLAIEVPPADLQAVAANEQWGDIYDRIAALINEHRTTLVFVNTRRMAERIAHNLGQRLGEEHVAAHHGSLSKDRRLRLEQRLKAGEMRAIVATASLELGIDVGTVDLVCQIGSPRAITTFLQRIGRSGHALGRTSRGRLFATTRDELLECAALIRAVRAGRLDRVEPPVAPLDILAQQIVAECACREWDEDALFDLVRAATPFAALSREDYDDVIEMLSEGAAPRVGRGRALLHRDRINRTLRGRRAARITAITCGGAIPEVADFRVILDPDETFIGTVNEDWAIESMAGDIFLLGSHSWKIRRVESARGVLRVEDAQGRPPSVPFWLGEAPGRTWELSEEVSRLRRDIAGRLSAALTPACLHGDSAIGHPSPTRGEGIDTNAGAGISGQAGAKSAGPGANAHLTPAYGHPSPRRGEGLSRNAGADNHDFSGTPADPAPPLHNVERGPGGEVQAWLQRECALDGAGAQQIVDYVSAEQAALGVVPSDTDVVFERFFDDAGGMQLVVHAPFGGRVNRGFGLALRKRFCVNFDFELQAAATDDAVVLSMGPQHSFPLEDAFSFVRASNVRSSLEQAILYAPMWGARWRWNATRALQVLRSNAGKQVPPAIQRMRSDDLLAAVFPQQVGCQENISGPLQIPDHPLTRQTVRDCLHEAMDVDRLEAVFEKIERGEIRLHARDTTEPSPFAHEILNAKPYAFLDDAPLEERRTRAVTLRRTLPESQRDLGQLDTAAIDRVRDEARPDPRDADELHDLLLGVVVAPAHLTAAFGHPSPRSEEGLSTGGDAGIGGDAGAKSEGPGAYAHLTPAFGHPSPRSGEGLSTNAGAGNHDFSGTPPDPAPPLHDVERGQGGEVHVWLHTLIAANRASIVRTPAGDLWFAAEHLCAVEQLYPNAKIDPPVRLPAHIDAASPTREDAVLAAVRGHMEYLGPATADGIAAMLGLGAGEVTSALARLEGEGIVLRGSFTPRHDEPSAGAKVEEWCDRRLLARIHRLTLDRLRSEIEPVTAQDFMRYLLARQHVAGPRRLEGKRGVLEAIAQLQGFEVAAIAWERDVLPMRVVNYNPQWLDELCLAGDVAWARLSLKKTTGAGRGASPQRATPITLALRRDLGRLLETVRGAQQPDDPVNGAAAATLDALRQHGALFFEDLAAASRQLPAQLEEALWDLVARGLVSGDGFQSLRQIMTPAGSARARAARRHSRGAGIRLPRSASPQGRWSIVHRFQPEPSLRAVGAAEELAASVAEQLLARYGVVFRDLVARENFAVPWRNVVRALRRMEARGTVRGGRFVAGFIGEQYALPEAVEGLRRTRREERAGDIVRISAADPLNLAGIITPGARVPALHTNAVIFRDGVPIAVEEGRNIVVRPEAGDIDLRDVLGDGRAAQSAAAHAR